MRNTVKEFALIILAWCVLFGYMYIILGIYLLRDYGVIKFVGFIICAVAFSEIMKISERYEK